MSFLSMLNMAKGKEPPPVQKPPRKVAQKTDADSRPSRPSTTTPSPPELYRRSEPAVGSRPDLSPTANSPKSPATSRAGVPAQAALIGRTAPSTGREALADRATSSGRAASTDRVPTGGSGSAGIPLNPRTPAATAGQSPSSPAPISSASRGLGNKPATPSKFPAPGKSAPHTKPAPYSRSVPAGERGPASPRGAASPVGSPAPAGPASSKPKKLSFKDVLKKADAIDRSKLEISLKTKTKDQTPPPLAKRSSNSTPAAPITRQPERASRPAPASRPANSSLKRGRDQPTPSRPAPDLERASRPRAPAPAAQPFPELAAKQRQRQQLKEQQRQHRRQQMVDTGEDLEDFVVSEDDEEELGAAQSREIWSIFNRNPRRLYDDSDSGSDMEAQGADILEEERRSAAQARREDILEEQRLAELARKKQKRR